MKLRDWASKKLGAKGKNEPLGFTLGSRLPPSRREQRVAEQRQAYDADAGHAKFKSNQAKDKNTPEAHKSAADAHRTAARSAEAKGNPVAADKHTAKAAP